MEIAPSTMCRVDRLALAGAGAGHCRTARPLWFRRSLRHIIAQVAVWQGAVWFTHSHGAATRLPKTLPVGLGAVWAGASDEVPDEPLDAAIIYAPSGELVPAALRAVRKGGRVGMRRHPHDRHSQLSIRSALAGTATAVGRQPDPAGWPRFFSSIAPQAGVRTETTAFPLHQANEVLNMLRAGQILGAAVLTP